MKKKDSYFSFFRKDIEEGFIKENTYSIPMAFEDNLISRSLDAHSYSEEWFSKEIKNTKGYFYKKLSEA